jgi:hypothetical protein
MPKKEIWFLHIARPGQSESSVHDSQEEVLKASADFARANWDERTQKSKSPDDHSQLTDEQVVEIFFDQKRILRNVFAHVIHVPIREGNVLKTDVWTCLITHKHGDDMTVHASQEQAQATAAEFARQFWQDRADKEATEDPDALSNEDCIDAYFNGHTSEFLQIEQHSIELPLPNDPLLQQLYDAINNFLDAEADVGAVGNLPDEEVLEEAQERANMARESLDIMLEKVKAVLDA